MVKQNYISGERVSHEDMNEISSFFNTANQYFKDGISQPYSSKQDAFDSIIYKVKKLTFVVLINGVETECWFKDGISFVEDIVEKTIDVSVLSPTNLFVGTDGPAGSAIDPGGNISVVGGSSKYRTITGILPNTTYTITGDNIPTQGFRISFRDVNNNVLGAFYNSTFSVAAPDGTVYFMYDKAPYKFTTPANCVKIIVNTVGKAVTDTGFIDPTPTMKLTLGTSEYDKYKAYSNYVGKEIVNLGDSKTENNLVPAVAQNILRNININLAIGGALITPGFENVVGDGVRRSSFVERVHQMNLFPNSTVVTIRGGANDNFYGAILGSPYDETVLSPTFAGNGQIVPSSVANATVANSLRHIVSYLQTTYPLKRIILISEQFAGTDVNTYPRQEAIANIMAATAAQFNVQYIDGFHNSGVNWYNSGAYTIDGTHENYLGALQMGTLIANAINTYGPSGGNPNLKEGNFETSDNTGLPVVRLTNKSSSPSAVASIKYKNDAGNTVDQFLTSSNYPNGFANYFILQSYNSLTRFLISYNNGASTFRIDEFGASVNHNLNLLTNNRYIKATKAGGSLVSILGINLLDQLSIGSADIGAINMIIGGAIKVAVNSNGLGVAVETPNSTLQVGGSFALKYNSTAASISLNGTHGALEVTAAGQTVTLPTAVGVEGRIYTIKLTAIGTATVDTTEGQLIDGAATYSLTSQNKYVTVQSNNTGWIIISNN